MNSSVGVETSIGSESRSEIEIVGLRALLTVLENLTRLVEQLEAIRNYLKTYGFQCVLSSGVRLWSPPS